MSSVADRSWLLLVYKVPPEPSANRVYVWRKLKRLAAILIHDSVWVLPPTPYTREQLQWLAAEIQEMGGEANLWEAQKLPPGQDDNLFAQFARQTDAAYNEILADLVSVQTDLAVLSRRYQQVKASDYFDSALGMRVRDALIAAKGGQEP